MKKTAAIVVTYNRKELLRENIESLLLQTVKDEMDIIIVDNASTDGTKEYIDEYIQTGKITYINTGANLGGAGGFQYGIKYAAENGYDYVWIMDDDSIPQADALEQLLKWDKKLNENYGFLASKVLWSDGSICNMNIQKSSISKKVTDFSSDSVKVISSTFVSMFVSTKIVREVGLPIKEFFIWCDDLEYTRRISKKYPCYLINESVVTHKCESNTGSNIASDTYERLQRYRYAYRNEVYYFRREGLKGKLYAFTRLIFHLTRVILKSRSKKMTRIKIILKATMSGFSFNPDIEYIDD